jgi:hypothetical protein
MASSFDLCECTRQLSEHACALWTEAAMLTHLTKEFPEVAPHRVVQLARKSAEVHRLAQGLHEMMSSYRTRSRQPGAPRLPRLAERRREGDEPDQD